LILAGVVLVFIGKIRAFRLAAARQIFFWLAVGCVCAYLMTVYALWFWEGFPLARYFQFPWRLFVILDLVLCFIMGGLAVIFNRRSRSAIVLIVAILLVMGHIGLCKPDPRPDRKYKDLAVTDWKAWIYSQHPQDVMEYLPVWVKRLSMVKPPALFQVVQGDGEIFSGKNIPAPRQELTVRSARGAGVLFHQYYFPGWKVYVDGKETSVSHENDFGLILFAVPPGEHRVVVVFEHSNVRIWAEVMSILGWVILFVMLVLSRRKDIPCALTEK
jgi:hypothetical protein